MARMRAKQIILDSQIAYESGVPDTPSTAKTLINKQHLEDRLAGVAGGLNWKAVVKVATINDSNWNTSVTIAFANPTLTISNLSAGASLGLIDGVEPAVDDRILIKNAADASGGAAASAAYDGIWVVTGGSTTSLTLERAPLADTTDELDQAVVAVDDGTEAGESFQQRAEVATVNTTDQDWGYYIPRPSSVNLSETSSVTSGDDQDTGITIDNKPSGDGVFVVTVNGIGASIGDGVDTADCYFADAGALTTPVALSAVKQTDHLIWNGTTAGYDLDASDVVSINYERI